MHLIIPAAGQSSRFPKLRPKWMLTHPNGNLMIAEAIRGLTIPNLEKIHVTVLASHMQEFKCREGLERQFQQLGLGNKLHVLELDAPTNSQPETVAKTIEAHGIKGPICIKDSDNFFRLQVPSRNFVSAVDLNTVGYINPSNKSYVAVNDDGIINNIAERRVISNLFCCGAYGFESADEYLACYRELAHIPGLYVSHVIYQMILANKAFSAEVSTEYSDWGTIKDWNRYKAQFGTLFIDLDGTLVKNSGEYFPPKWGETGGIDENIRAVNQLHQSGKVQVIIVTSRKEEARAATLAQLERLGIKYHQILFGITHGRRIVINDYARSNPFKSCDAINIARDATDLPEMLEAVLHVPQD